MEDKIAEKVIQAAYAVHRSLGAGFLESVYLQATGIEIGLLINFGAPSAQIKRKYKEYRQTKPPVSQLSLRPVNPENPVNPCVLKVVID